MPEPITFADRSAHWGALPRRAALRTLAGGALALAMGSTAAAELSAQEILAASDAVRYPGHGFSVVNTLVEYRQGRQTDSSSLMVYSRADASGQFRNLVRFVAPARDAGKLMLYIGRDLWFHDPAQRATVRLSPQQRLLGQASNGDVVTVNLARDYQATDSGQEEVADGERVRRNCHRLTLAGRTAEAAYHRIELWVTVDGHRPVKARYLADSGALLKTAYFRRYADVLGVQRPTETVIIDGLEPGWVTVMRLSDWTRREVPEAWLQRDHLPRFQPD